MNFLNFNRLLLSINVGFFGEDKTLLNSDWNSEYNTDKSTLNNENIFPISFYYEIAPNEKSNIVSKHCVIGKNTGIESEFYSTHFDYHANW